MRSCKASAIRLNELARGVRSASARRLEAGVEAPAGDRFSGVRHPRKRQENAAGGESADCGTSEGCRQGDKGKDEREKPQLGREILEREDLEVHAPFTLGSEHPDDQFRCRWKWISVVSQPLVVTRQARTSLGGSCSRNEVRPIHLAVVNNQRWPGAL